MRPELVPQTIIFSETVPGFWSPPSGVPDGLLVIFIVWKARDTQSRFISGFSLWAACCSGGDCRKLNA